VRPKPATMAQELLFTPPLGRQTTVTLSLSIALHSHTQNQVEDVLVCSQADHCHFIALDEPTPQSSSVQ
jgi:hypothetical protein